MKFKRRQKTPKYHYTLPQDAERVKLEGKAWATVLVGLDFLNQTVKKRADVEAFGREQIAGLQAEVARNQQTLTNDLEAFSAVFLPAFVQVYEESRMVYADPERLEFSRRQIAGDDVPTLLMRARVYWAAEAKRERPPRG